MSVMEGSLSKWTNVMKGWQYRWFVLDENAGLLSYYTSKEKMMRGVRRGCVRLKGAVIGIDDEDDSTFTITVDHKTFHFQARDADERESWVRALEETILRHSSRMRWESHRAQPTITDFDNKVSEADAYLQIMIDQTKRLEDRIPTIVDPEEQEKYKIIQDHSNTMLDNIKHSIVLLQIAKNTAHPVNGIYQGPGVSSSGGSPVRAVVFTGSTEDMDVQTGIEVASDCLESVRRHSRCLAGSGSPITLIVPETSYSSSEGEDDFFDANDAPFTPSSQISSPTVIRAFTNEESTVAAPLDAKVEVNLSSNTMTVGSTTAQVRGSISCRAPQPGSSHNTAAAAAAAAMLDTADPTAVPSSLAKPRASLPVREDGSLDYDGKHVFDNLHKHHYPVSNVHTSPYLDPIDGTFKIQRRPDGELDYDALYEEEVEEDSSLIESNGSVVTHLISQIKIGMDLTKVVLPTFILERRSLLEMYADYFAHPDIFLRIADISDPRERMVQVVRWYLSSYHAGRKSSVAKKPYNPVIGEVFRCYWDIPADNENPGPVEADPALVQDGPVPWGSRDQLTFASEQVSHHPPISAFYAEHYNKRISFCAHVYTKSKFLGLSVCVYNIGQGTITLMDYNEEYTVTFPNGYGRSILTVPWIELGGNVKIECPTTGYHADVEFITKPFYSNKKHRVTADVYSPTDKHPFLKIAGEWNGQMEAKWTDGKTETFVDVNKLSVVKKKVLPISQQEANESRRLWKDVTAGLRFNDIEKATQAKSELEQRQRDEAKDRSKTNTKWETKLFRQNEEQWLYISPLAQRIAQARQTEPSS